MTAASATQTIVDKLESTRAAVLQTVQELDEAMLTWKPSDGRWSIRQTMAHLADTEDSHLRVAQAIAAGETLELPGFELDAWNAAAVAEREDRSTEDILAELSANRERTLATIMELDAEALDLTGDHPVLGEMTVGKVLRIISIHERRHLKDIQRLIAEQRGD